MSTRYLRVLIYAPLAFAFGVMAVVLHVAGTSTSGTKLAYPSEQALHTQVEASVFLAVIGVVGFLTSLPPQQDGDGWASWLAIGYDLIIGLGVFAGFLGGVIILGGVPPSAPIFQVFSFLQAYTAVYFFLGAVVGWRALRQVMPKAK
jgi:hypothetical protein